MEYLGYVKTEELGWPSIHRVRTEYLCGNEGLLALIRIDEAVAWWFSNKQKKMVVSGER